MDNILQTLYYKYKNYDGINNLYIKAKKYDKNITLKYVKEWLNKQATHQQTFENVEKKDYKPIYAYSPFSFQIDLTFLPKYKIQNEGNYVLFTAININTRYAYAYYSKDKSMKSILDLLKKFKKDAIEITYIMADKGTEFNNKEFINFLNDNDIEFDFEVGDSHKLGIINRFHRTLKDKLLKYMIAENTTKWIDIIDTLIYNYNHTINRGIGIEPANVNPIIENQIITERIEQTNIKPDKPFKIDDIIRIKQSNKLFDKMTPSYSNDTYRIIKVNKQTVIAKDKNNNDGRYKKSNIIIVNTIENDKSIVEIDKAVKENKIVRRLKKVGIDNIEPLTSGMITRSKKNIGV